MPKSNPYLIKENYKKVEEVREINNEVPSFEEFMKTYESDEAVNYDDLTFNDISDRGKGYGPCKNSLCGCTCSSYSCKCSSASVRIGEAGTGWTAHGRKWKEEINPTDMDELALKAAGVKDLGVSGQISGSAFGYRDSGGELKVLSGSAGGEISRSSIKGKLSADLYNVKSDGVQVRVGVAADTGISVEDGLEVKAVGFGFSVGKQTGLSTPFGEVKVDTEDCIIQ